MGVERRCECSELARTAYGACASDGRSADAWTERAPILRGGEGVNNLRVLINVRSRPKTSKQDHYSFWLLRSAPDSRACWDFTADRKICITA